MKKKVLIISTIFTLILTSIFIAGCGDVNNTDSDSSKEYVIQYSDESGVYKENVVCGELYQIKHIPSKVGHQFQGLYTEKDGKGVQYVDSNGSSIDIFNDIKNMQLFPYFIPNTYKIILDYYDYQDEKMDIPNYTGDRSYEIEYGQNIPLLAARDLDMPGKHKNFKGWYTEKNCNGIQIADRIGVLPDKEVLDVNNYVLPQDKIFRFYAGYEMEKIDITVHFSNKIGDIEVVTMDYGKKLYQIVTDRSVDGKKPCLFNDDKNNQLNPETTIINDMDIYAIEYLPYVEYDMGNGDKLLTQIAEPGSTIALPVPEREGYVFSKWIDSSNNVVNSLVMPENSIKLKALWKATIKFDSNGGTLVSDIVEEQGKPIKLPNPTRAGYLFAGWYDGETKVDREDMPKESLKLKAGWYKTKEVEKIILANNSEATVYNGTADYRFAINFVEEFPTIDWNDDLFVTIDFHAEVRHYSWNDDASVEPYATKEYFSYSNNQKGGTVLGNKVFDHGQGVVNTNWVTLDPWTVTLPIQHNGMLYIGVNADKDCHIRYSNPFVHEGHAGWKLRNFYITIHYPDTSVIY